MVRIWGIHCRDPGSILGWGTEILQAVQHGQKKKKEKEKRGGGIKKKTTPSEFDDEARPG